MICHTKTVRKNFVLWLLLQSVGYSLSVYSQNGLFLEQNYDKKEYRIPMRDGTKLFTAVYSPKDTTQEFPILIWRTPYSLDRYGEDDYISYRRETWHHFAKEKFIIVFQDVRGRFMSEGNYINMRPYVPEKKNEYHVDESSDAYDTIDWLVKNIPHNNGRVGIWGISYPGFYAAMAAIDSHPALKAVSPQAPIADWFTGDDIHHHGAFALASNFSFFFYFGIPRSKLITEWPDAFEFPTPDGYQFFLELGSVKNVNEKYFNWSIPFWNDIMKHCTYDEFWKSRNLRPHLRNIIPAILVVGGWFDAENAYGALQTYYSIERQSPKTRSTLVMGPWFHGGWVRSDGSKLGDISFGSSTGEFYVKNIELPFFNYYLKDKECPDLPEAYVFETGSNRWKKYAQWPPENIEQKKIYLNNDYSISFDKISQTGNMFHEYISDPSKPVPFTSRITTEIPITYMIEDQRFVAQRLDVLVYKSSILEEDITVVGPILADLYVSTSNTDCDWVVKLIDVYPDNLPDSNNVILGGYQMLVRAEIIRSKFRNSYEKPEPMNPNVITHIQFYMNDINYSFLKGHKIMIQIQSSWFPLFDRNPQSFVDIYHTDENDFRKSTQRVFLTIKHPTGLIVNILNK